MCLGKASGYREAKENKTEKVSLLKPYTNFEKIKSMTLDEMTEFLEKVNCSACAMICSQTPTECEYTKLNTATII